MKKFFVLAAVSMFVLASCRKDYTCDCGYGISVTYTKLKKADADALGSSCRAGGCSWSSK
jgi:hypothetical protein